MAAAPGGHGALDTARAPVIVQKDKTFGRVLLTPKHYFDDGPNQVLCSNFDDWFVVRV